MSTINFTNPKNQQAWESYKQNKIAENVPNTSLLQYKESALQIERSCNNKSFSDLTIDGLKDSHAKKPMKVNHINGFLVDCVNAGLFNLSNDVKLEIIPKHYKLFVASMFK